MDGEPIDFLAKKAQRDEKKRASNESAQAEVSLKNFFFWAWNSTKAIAILNDLDLNDYKVRFNNKKIRGEFAYEKHRDEKRNYWEETLSFVEFGGENRVLQYSLENGKPFVMCQKQGQTDEATDMTTTETLTFLQELGSPFELTDEFPYEPNLKTIK